MKITHTLTRWTAVFTFKGRMMSITAATKDALNRMLKIYEQKPIQ